MKLVSTEREYLERVLCYTEACLTATCKESENSVEVVGKLLDTLAQDIARISSMSNDTVKALSEVRNMIASSKADRKVIGAVSVRSLVSALKQINKEHQDIQDVILPLITTLQFQDRVRQQMENLIKMLRVWMTYRTQEISDNDSNLQKFGTLLGETTTTEEEREVLKKLFPGVTFAQKLQTEDDFFL